MSRPLRMILCAACVVTIVRAQPPVGGKVSFTDLRGREFKDAQVMRVEPGVLVLMTDSGVSRVPAASLPENIRKLYEVTDARPVQASPPPSIEPSPASADHLQMAQLDQKISKLKAEIEGLDNSRRLVQEDFDKGFAAAKIRFDAAYEREMKDYQTRAMRRSYNRAPLDAPEVRDPATEPAVARLKERLEVYDQQLRERRQWLEQFNGQKKQISDRLESVTQSKLMAEARVQERAMAEQRQAEKDAKEAERAAMVQQSRDERKQYIEEAERKDAAKTQARRDEQTRTAEEKRKRVDEGTVLMLQLAGSGKTGDGLVAFQALVADRDLWDFEGSQPASRLCEAGLTLFEAARKSGDLAVAATALRTSVSLDSDSPKIVEHLIAFFQEGKGLIAKGDFSGLIGHMAHIEGSGVEDHHLCVRNKQELSNLALSEGWRALRVLNVMRAGAAVDAARKLWDRNPRLGWLRNSVSAAFLLGILGGIFVIAKASEKAYWWLNNR